MSKPKSIESETPAAVAGAAPCSASDAFISALRCVTDAAIHNTLIPRGTMAEILRTEAAIIEECREHYALPAAPQEISDAERAAYKPGDYDAD